MEGRNSLALSLVLTTVTLQVNKNCSEEKEGMGEREKGLERGRRDWREGEDRGLIKEQREDKDRNKRDTMDLS